MLVSVELTAMTCDCGGVYALQEHFREKKKRDGGTWWCPYCGSRRAYTETEVQKLTKALEEKQRRLHGEKRTERKSPTRQKKS